MVRYLLNVAYIGTIFRGLQRLVSVKNGYVEDLATVQGQIEMVLRKMRPLNEPYVVISSRTDSAVHALHTTMHVDLEGKNGRKYVPRDITTYLNKHFSKESVPIRILKTYIVPDTFHCRAKALSRTYLYRLAVVKSDKLDVNNLLQHIPIEELERCFYMCTNTFNIDKLREAANLFIGYHDFRSFMAKSPKQPDKITRRTIDTLNIEEVQLNYYTKYSWPFCINSKISDYKFFNIYIKANGFLHKQVRRTVGSLIAVAQGKITSRDIKFMIEVPSHRSWEPQIKPVPAQGLYLCEVTYSQCDLDTFQEHLQV